MKRILLLLLLAFTCYNIQATHLMGGEITWKCIKSGANAGSYVFEVKVYRDCQGVAISTSLPLMVPVGACERSKLILAKGELSV